MHVDTRIVCCDTYSFFSKERESCGLAESRPLVINNDLSHLGGYIYSIGLVKAVSESLQELVRASSSSMLVTLNNV